MKEQTCVNDLANYQRPRERFYELGPEQVKTEELLAILLRTGRKGATVMEVAREILDLVGHEEYELNRITLDKLQSIKGIGADKAITICAAIELGRRLSAAKAIDCYDEMTNPCALAMYVMERMRHLREEHFCAALFTARNALIRIDTIAKGGIAGSYAEQRTLFRHAIEANAASIILIHNHPSGDPAASAQDIRITRTFVSAGDMMGIPILDHIIIGDGRFISFVEDGLI